MKNFAFLLMTALTLTLVACGDKELNKSGKKTSSSVFDAYRSTTVEGYVNPQQPIFEVGDINRPSATYTFAEQSYPVVNAAFHKAFQQGIKPINVNGVMKLKARITGMIVTNPQPQQQQPGQPQQAFLPNYINVQEAVIYP